MSFLQTDHTPVAMDIQDDRVVAVQLVRRKGKWQRAASVIVKRQPTADASGEKTLALSGDEFATIERALTRQGVIGRQIVLMSPAAATCIELLELPPRGPGTPIEQLARAEISRLARWDDSTPFQLMTWDVPSPLRRAGTDAPPTTSLYAAALQQSTVETFLAQAWDLGWSICRIVPAPMAAAAIAAETGSTDDGVGKTAVVIDLRRERASFTLVRGTTPIYHRDLPDNGLSLLIRALVSDLNLSEADATLALDAGTFELRDASSRAYPLCESFAEALASELEASLAFAARRYGELKVESLVVVGAGSQIGGIDQWLCSRLEVSGSGANALGASSSDLTIAGCVALAKASVSTMKDRGLLPDDHRDLIRREHVARLWIAAAATITLFAGASVGTLYATSFAPADRDTSLMAGLQKEQARADADAAEAKKTLTELQTLAAFEERIIHQPDYGIVLRLIGDTLDRDAVLRELALAEPTGTRAVPSAPAPALRRVKLTGVAPNPAVLTDQVKSLRAIDVFDHVELARTSRTANGEGVTFELTLDVVGRALTQGAK